MPFCIACCIFCVDFLKCFGRHLGSLGPSEIIPKCRNICNFIIFQSLETFGAESVLGSASGRVLACAVQEMDTVWEFIGTPFSYFEQFLRALISEVFFVRYPGVNILRNALAGSRDRNSRFCLGQGSTRLAGAGGA